MAAGSGAVLSSFLINLCIAAGVFCAFSIIRSQPWCRRFFAPRRFAKDLDLKPKRLPTSLLGWVWPVLTYREEDVIDEAGLDCAIYLRILRFGVYLFWLLSVWCLLTVLPANLTSQEIKRILDQRGANDGTVVNGNVLRFTDFDRYSLTNVEPGSAKMWAHLVSVHFVVLVTLWLLWRFNRQSVILRLMFLGNAKRGGPSHTVLVTDIPGVSEVERRRKPAQDQQQQQQQGVHPYITGAPEGPTVLGHTPTTPQAEQSGLEAAARSAALQNRGTVSPFAAFSGAGGSDDFNAGSNSLEQSALVEQVKQQHIQVQMTHQGPSGVQQTFRATSARARLQTTSSSGDGGVAAVPDGVLDRHDGSGGDAGRWDVFLHGSRSGDHAMPEHGGGGGGHRGVSLTPPSSGTSMEVPSGGQSKLPSAAGAATLYSSCSGDLDRGRAKSFTAAAALEGGGGISRSGYHTSTATGAPAGGAAGLRGDMASPARGGASGAASPPRSLFPRWLHGGQKTASVPGKGGPCSVAITTAAASGQNGGDDDVWRYAAVGGKLEEPRVGLSNEELLCRLEAAIDPDETVLSRLPAEWGIDTAPQLPCRRATKRYNYDTNNCDLDAIFQAKQQLQAGLTPQQFVAREFAMVYSPANIAAVNMVHDTATLRPLVDEYNQIREQLEDYLDMQQLRLRLRRAMPHKQVTVLGAKYGDWGKKYTGTWWFKKVDAVDFWLSRLKFLRDRIMDEQRTAARKVAPSAFVTFTTHLAQAVAANSLHHQDVDAWRVHNTPAPFEVVWKNLGLTMTMKGGRVYFLWAAFWAMTLFFMIPVTAIQALIEVPKLAQVPVLGEIVTAPVIRQLLEAIVPGLALKVFLAVVPVVLRHMALLSGATSVSEIDFGVVKRYFLFQVVVVFFGNIIAGSFFNQVNQWLKNPGTVITTLGKSIPMTSTFFITYLLTNGLSVKSLAFIRLPNFIIFWILSKFAGSPRARMRMWMYQYTDNGTTVVDHTIALLLGLTFSCINPIVCLAALTYFLVNFLGETYNNVYVFRRAYESAGRLWKTVYNQVMVGLYIMQLTMLGLLSLKKFPYAPLSIPLLLFTVASHFSTLTLYRRPWSVMSLHDAAELDMREAEQRRLELLRAARTERRAAAGDLRRLPAVPEGSAASGRSDQTAPLLLPQSPGGAERLFRRALQDEHVALALREDEQAEVADMYKDPCFKVPLDDICELEELAKDLRPRMDLLNDWSAQLKKQQRRRGRNSKPGGTIGATAAAPAGPTGSAGRNSDTSGGERAPGGATATAGGSGGYASPSFGVWIDGQQTGGGEQAGRQRQEAPEAGPLELTKYDNRRLSNAADSDSEF